MTTTEEQLREALARAEKAERERDEALGRLGDLESEAKRLRQERDDLRFHYDRQKGELVELRERAERAERERDAALADSARYQARVVELERRLATIRCVADGEVGDA